MAAPTLSTSEDLDEQTKRDILIVESYWFYQRSCDSVRNRVREFFGRANLPTNMEIKRLVDKFDEIGSITQRRKGSGRSKTATNDENISLVREFFEENRSYSIRRASLVLDMNRSSVHSILRKKIKTYPYKIQLYHALSQWDADRRDQFAFRMSSRIRIGTVQILKTWFTDESHFWLDGYVNKQNYRIWGTENPRAFETASTSRTRVTVWCAVSAVGLIGPFFFDGNVNSDAYCKMLAEEFIPVAQGLGATDDWWFMQDGATCHRTSAAFKILDEHFHGRVIGLDYEPRFGCGIEWPPNSPDLNPCDYYLWGKLKDKVYRTKPRTLEQLKEKIIEESRQLTAEELKRAIENFPERLEATAEAVGQHIEQFIRQ